VSSEPGKVEAAARPRVVRSAVAMTGGWSVGESDENVPGFLFADCK
jgi:hypothetical protein